MIRASLLLIAFTFTVGPACKSKDDGKGGSAKTAESKGPTKLPKLGLELDAPGGPEVGDAIMGEGHMLQGSGIGAMSIEVAEKPQTLDEAKADADMYTPKNLKAEPLPDGWVLTFDNTGSMGKNFFVEVRRDIGGKTYKCTTTGSEASQAAAVVAACKTLRKGA
ncbi:MAG: hypothetical protein H0T42_33060 [Deltaproteobacteria bacterium]|nr:hypothetical protein [Deltaproteobacteria bacterium]